MHNLHCRCLPFKRNAIAIVGNFRGEKFQDFLLSKTFHKLNVKDLLHYHCACITIHGKSFEGANFCGCKEISLFTGKLLLILAL